jgi:hypothetical protein
MFAWVIIGNLVMYAVAAWVIKEKKQRWVWLIVMLFFWPVIYGIENRNVGSNTEDSNTNGN